MNAFGLGKLISRPAAQLTAFQVIRWWEIRRIAFNLIVGAAGLFTGSFALVVAFLLESSGREAVFPDPPLFAVFGVILYGIMANVCYTGGWMCELIARRFWRAEAAAFGRLSFLFGLIGSVLLTLLPVAFILVFSLISRLRPPSLHQP